MVKKALIVTRASGFLPQFEGNNVRILQKEGYEVHYATNFDVVVYGTDNSRLDGLGLVCHHIPFCRSPFSRDVLHSMKLLRDLMEEEKFDLVHCHMPVSGVVARIAAQQVRKKTGRKIPVLYTTHGFHFFHGAPFKNWLYYFPERWLARYTDCLITLNEEDYRRACRFPVRGQVKKVPGVGIDLEKNQVLSTEKRQEMRKKFGVSETDFMLVSVGELNANKNHMQMIRMLKRHPQPDIKYIICGMGTMQSEIQTFITENSLENQVILAGYSHEIAEILMSADCFVFPSLREGLSVALMEAMRAGLPVVAKKIRGNVDLIEDKKGGFLLETGSEQEYMQAVLSLKNDRKLAHNMGEWNQQRVKLFSNTRVSEKMQLIYKEISG